MHTLCTGLIAVSQAHPDHQRLNSGTPVASDHEHSHQGLSLAEVAVS